MLGLGSRIDLGLTEGSSPVDGMVGVRGDGVRLEGLTRMEPWTRRWAVRVWYPAFLQVGDEYPTMF